MSSPHRRDRLRPDFVWTAEAEVELLRLWRDGLPGRDIANAIGCTRNAAIGKLHRLAARTDADGALLFPGLLRAKALVNPPQPPRQARAALIVAEAAGRRGRAGKDNTKAVRRARERAKPAASVTRRTAMSFGAGLDSPGPLEADLKALKSAAWLPLDGRAPVPLEALGRSDCRWPLGDPLDPDFGFCGLEARDGRRYCDRHHALAHAKPVPKAAPPAQSRPSASDRAFSGEFA